MAPTESTDARRSHSKLGGIVAAIGGVAVIAGTLFELLSVTVGRGAVEVSASKTYFDTDNGKVVAAVGVVVLVLAMVTVLWPGGGFVVPILIAACGLAAFGFALYDRIDLDDASAAVGATFGPALYVAMAGGLVATIGAMLAARDA